MFIPLTSIKRAAVGLLSAGGAFLLAACYGPQRTPVGPVSGSVRDSGSGGPLPGARVCVRPKAHPEQPHPCVDADEKGAFTVPRFNVLGGPGGMMPDQEICATVKPDAPGLEPRTRCVPYDPELSGNTVIDFANLR